jgi:hypothetical protein
MSHCPLVRPAAFSDCRFADAQWSHFPLGFISAACRCPCGKVYLTGPSTLFFQREAEPRAQ